MAGFASAADLADKTVPFGEIGPGLYAHTAKREPNSGFIVENDGVVVVDALAMRRM